MTPVQAPHEHPGDVVLVVNTGSGTIDATVYEVPDDGKPLRPVWQIDVVRHTRPQQVTVTAADTTIEYEARPGDLPAALQPGIEMLWNCSASVIDAPDRVVAVGHRIVHGGDFEDPREVTPQVRREIERMSRLAPLHNPPGLEAIDVTTAMLPEARQIAVFDTSFHTTMPAAARAFGGPRHWFDEGLRRYGFHGISHRGAAGRAAESLGRSLDDLDLITVHLGGGCSAAAVAGGRSVDTTMGLTPTDGMVMAARSGRIDPGMIIHLLRRERLDADELEALLNRHAGLIGLTKERTGDIGVVHRSATDGDEVAALAEDVYVHSLVREIASLRPTLAGLDALVLTGSVAKRQPWLRRRICERLSWLGIDVDVRRNDEAPADAVVDIATSASTVRVVLVPTDENRSIAEATIRIGRRAGASGRSGHSA